MLRCICCVSWPLDVLHFQRWCLPLLWQCHWVDKMSTQHSGPQTEAFQNSQGVPWCWISVSLAWTHLCLLSSHNFHLMAICKCCCAIVFLQESLQVQEATEGLSRGLRIQPCWGSELLLHAKASHWHEVCHPWQDKQEQRRSDCCCCSSWRQSCGQVWQENDCCDQYWECVNKAFYFAMDDIHCDPSLHGKYKCPGLSCRGGCKDEQRHQRSESCWCSCR